MVSLLSFSTPKSMLKICCVLRSAGIWMPSLDQASDVPSMAISSEEKRVAAPCTSAMSWSAETVLRKAPPSPGTFAPVSQTLSQL